MCGLVPKINYDYQITAHCANPVNITCDIRKILKMRLLDLLTSGMMMTHHRITSFFLSSVEFI